MAGEEEVTSPHLEDGSCCLEPGQEWVPPGDPKYNGFRVTELWIATAVDPQDNSEGIIGDPNSPLPGEALMASDERRLEQYVKPIVAELTKVLPHQPITIKHFRLVEEA